MAGLAGADTCVAPVLAVAEVADDPGFAGRGSVVEARHPTRGSFRQLAPLLAGMVRPAGPGGPARPVGRPTPTRSWRRPGSTPSAIGAWRARGAIA